MNQNQKSHRSLRLGVIVKLFFLSQPDQESIDNDSVKFSPLPKKSSVSSLPPMSDRAIDDAESQPSTSSGPQPLPEEEEPDLADPRAALSNVPVSEQLLPQN